MSERRPSRRVVLVAIGGGVVALFVAGVAFQALTRDTDAVDFRGGHYVDPVPLTRAQAEADYGAFAPTGGRIDGRRVLAPMRPPRTNPPRLLFVLDANKRTGVLYGLAK